MPVFSLGLPEVDKSISRPVVMNIVRQLMEITGIPKTTAINYRGHSDSTAQQGSIMGQDERDNTILEGDSLITLEVIEKYDDNGVATTAVSRTENHPFFLDDKLGVICSPIYTNNEYELNVQYRDKSRTAVLRWRDDIRVHTSQGRGVNTHDATYHYAFPVEFLAIIAEIHRLRENVHGYGETLDEYIVNCSTTRLTKASTLDGKYSEYVVAENQTRIQGIFDFSVAPSEIVKGPHAGLWQAEFTYRFYFDKPIQANIQYPIMVHNQLLDLKYIPEPSYDFDKVDKSFPLSRTNFHYFEVDQFRKNFEHFEPVVRIPTHDEFIPDNMAPGMVQMATVLCEVDETDKRWLCNLDDIEFDTEILEFFRKVEYPYLTKPYKSVFHISNYRWMFLSDYKNLSVNAALQVRTNHDLNLRDNHRVQFSMVQDLSSVDPQAFIRMRRYPNVLRKALLTVGANSGTLKLMAPRINLLDYFKDLPDVGQTLKAVYDNYTFMKTVNTAYVIARDGARSDKIKDYKQG